MVAAERVGARAIVLTGAGFTLVDLGFTALTWEESLQKAACKNCTQSNNFLEQWKVEYFKPITGTFTCQSTVRDSSMLNEECDVFGCDA